MKQQNNQLLQQQKSKNKFKIIKVDYGIASVYNDGTLEINRKLKGVLKEKVLAHELRHSGGNYNLKDFHNDFSSKDSSFWKVLIFALKNPECLIGYFMFMYSYYLKKLTYNSSALYPFGYFGLIFVLFFIIFFKISVFNAVLGWVILYLSINLILLLSTHLHVLNH